MTTELISKPAANSKLDNGMIAALSIAIARGNYAVTACQLCGISEPTFYSWINQGIEDEKKGLTERESMFLCLLKSLKKAEADSEDKMVDLICRTAVERKDGYLGMTYLERRHPDRWGRRDRTRIDINETKEITITHVEYRLPGHIPGQVIEGESRELLEGEK